MLEKCSKLLRLELSQGTSLPRFKSLNKIFFPTSFFFKDLTKALKMLGINPLEQEIMDIANENSKNGLISFQAFCSVVHKKYRNFSFLLLLYKYYISL